jgi:peptidoglycan/xylan/chitin deacetylase (PgdA/CDA1 family)
MPRPATSTVLLYHALDSIGEPYQAEDAADHGLAVEVKSFREQLNSLAEMGLPVVPLANLLDGDLACPGNGQVVLTFDDGHKSNWSLALPELLDAGAVATFYVIAGKVDTHADYMTSPQLRELLAHGMSVGSHTMTHPFLPLLDREGVRRELNDSKRRLEDVLGAPVLDLALPGGHGNRTVFDAARECGYRSVATCKVGVFRQGDNPMKLPRIEIRRGLSSQRFGDTFRTWKMRQLQLLEAGKSCLRNSLGLTNYTRLRRLAHRCLAIHR